MSKRDYYEVLGVSRTADESELKSAYRKIAMKSHPDRHPGDKAAEDRFKEAAEAYAVLADAEKRSLYDRFGHAGVKSAPGGAGFDPSVFSEFGDFADILGGMFGFGDLFGGGRRRGGPQRGADLRYDLEISFEESAKGTETTIQIPRQELCEACRFGRRQDRRRACARSAADRAGPVQQGFFTVARTVPNAAALASDRSPCQTCRGAGRVSHDRKLTVKIPAGIADGQQLRLQSEGEGGIAGGPAGHLYVVVYVHEHEFFRRDGLNLFCEIPVNFTTLALGGEIVVPTLDGPDSVKVPEGTETGTTLRLRGKGMQDVGGRGRGDLFATVQVQTPKKPTKEQRHLLEQLAKVLPKERFEPRPHDNEQDERNLFDRVKRMFG